MPDSIYFFDTYAVIEILKGNKNYKKFENSMIFLTKLNLFELHYAVLRNSCKKEANEILDKYYDFVIDFDNTIIKKASELKLKLKKRKISMTDSIGYILAAKLDVKFLTGDKEFEHMDNVEFIK